MIRRRWGRVLLAAVAIAAVAVTAGCGVPSGGKPIADGPPSLTDSANDGGIPVVPPLPTGYPAGVNQVPAYFSTGYLDAVAGQIGTNAQHDAAAAFMTPDLDKHWKTPSPQITVVRIHDVESTPTPTNDGYSVKLHVVVVGVYDPQSGSVLPPPSGAPETLPFRIQIIRGTMYLSDAPDGMYLNEDALHESQYYSQQVIYFWNQDHGLIPDLRYEPESLSAIQRATTVVKWILAGPPAWMAGAAVAATPDVQLVDNTLPVPPGSNTFVVSLNSAARALQPAQQADLLVQIRWSLGSIRAGAAGAPPSAVQLVIPNQSSRTDSDAAYIAKNQASGRTSNPVEYAIDNQKVRPVTAVKGDSVPALPNGAPNTHVVLAAVHSTDGAADPDRAAFVRAVAGREQLWLRRGGKTVGPIRMGSSTSATTFERPVWLAAPKGALAFVADGHFYVLPDGKDQALPVAVPNVDSIGAFSVAPDGSQVAFVAHGELWTSLLEIGANASASAPPSLTSPRLLSVQPSLTTVTAVAWSAVDQLIVGGANDKSAATIEVYADGTYTNRDPEINAFGELSVSQVVAFPLSPDASLAGTPFVMVQTNSFACEGRATCQTLAWSPAAANAPPPTSPFYPD